MVEAAETRKHEGFMTKIKRKKMERDMKKGKTTGALGTGATTGPNATLPLSTVGATANATTGAPIVSQPMTTGFVGAGAAPVSIQSGFVTSEATTGSPGPTSAPLVGNTTVGTTGTTTGFTGNNSFSDNLIQKKQEHDFKSGKELSPEDQGKGHALKSGGYKWKQTSHFTGENIDDLNYRKVE